MQRGSGRSKGVWKRMATIAMAGMALLALAGTAMAVDVKVGGYTKLDIVWSDRIGGGGNGSEFETVTGAAGVPLDKDLKFKRNDFNLDIRENRFNITGTGEINGVKTKGVIEADFFTGDGNRNVSNSRRPRLRFAYGMATLPSGLFILGGQNWSNFMDLETYPDTIDFNGMAGQLYTRQAQLRIGTTVKTTTGTITPTFSIESGSVLGPAASTLPQSQELPLLTGKVVWAAPFATFQVAGAVTRNRVVLNDTTESKKNAWGGTIGVSVPVPGVPLTLMGNYNHLDGANRLGDGDFTDAAIVDNVLTNVKTNAYYVGAGYTLTPTTNLNAVYGYRKATALVDPSAPDGFDSKQRSFHINVMQKIFGNMKTGIEYQHVSRETFAGDSGSMSRVQAAWWYYF